MKKYFLILLLLPFCSPVFAGNILVFGDRNTDRNNIANTLTSLGHNVTNSTSLPSLSGFDTVWHVSASGSTLSSSVQNSLANFIAGGGGVHLTGERPCCEDLNNQVTAFIHNVVVGSSGINVGDLGDISGSHSFNSSSVAGISGNWSPSGPGGISGLQAKNVLATGAGGVAVGAAFDSDQMVSGAGRLTVLMDVNWYSNTNADNITAASNIQTFLSQGGSGTIPEPSSVLLVALSLLTYVFLPAFRNKS